MPKESKVKKDQSVVRKNEASEKLHGLLKIRGKGSPPHEK